jgi:hypothetical protein
MHLAAFLQDVWCVVCVAVCKIWLLLRVGFLPRARAWRRMDALRIGDPGGVVVLLSRFD